MNKVYLVILCALGAGCATNTHHQFFPKTGQGQSVSYSMGIATTVSEKEKSTVAISPAGISFEGRSAFNVAVYNNSDEEFQVSSNSIKVSTLEGEVRIVTARQLATEARSRARSQQIGAAFAAFGESMSNAADSTSTGYTTSSSTYSGTSSVSASGSNGSSAYGIGTYSGFGSGSSVTTTYDAAKNAELDAETRRRTAVRSSEIKAQLTASLASANRTLQRTTVYPGNSFSSSFVLESFGIRDGGSPVTVFVTAGTEVHEFRFRAQLVQ